MMNDELSPGWLERTLNSKTRMLLPEFVPRNACIPLCHTVEIQKHGRASSGPRAIAPRCGRAPSVVSERSPRAVRVESDEWQMAS